MALLKQIELDSGVVLNYHRIVAITKVTNHSIILEIASYTNKEKRQQEIQQLEACEEITAYIDTTFMSVDYDEASTIKDWYTYLKTTEKYIDAEDDEDISETEE
jgi:superfamily II RNA helicase